MVTFYETGCRGKVDTRRVTNCLTRTDLSLGLGRASSSVATVILQVQRGRIMGLVVNPPDGRRRSRQCLGSFFSSRKCRMVYNKAATRYTTECLSGRLVSLDRATDKSIPTCCGLRNARLIARKFLAVRRLLRCYRR